MCRACRVREKSEKQSCVGHWRSARAAKYISLLIKHTWNNQPPPCSRHIKENWTWILYLRYICAWRASSCKRRVCPGVLLPRVGAHTYVHAENNVESERVDYANRRFREKAPPDQLHFNNSHQKCVRLEWEKYFCFRLVLDKMLKIHSLKSPA